jgi:hypothetical protein
MAQQYEHDGGAQIFGGIRVAQLYKGGVLVPSRKVKREVIAPDPDKLRRRGHVERHFNEPVGPPRRSIELAVPEWCAALLPLRLERDATVPLSHDVPSPGADHRAPSPQSRQTASAKLCDGGAR